MWAAYVVQCGLACDPRVRETNGEEGDGAVARPPAVLRESGETMGSMTGRANLS